MDRAEPSGEAWQVVDRQRDHMLKLVTKGFFNELVNYGVKREEMLRVASHLLDNLLSRDLGKAQPRPTSDSRFTLRPLGRALLPRLSEWLRAPGVSESFVRPFPVGQEALESHLFGSPERDYLEIDVSGETVGIIGGESLDHASGRMEMRKLVGDPDRRGQGIGKRATFGFIYYAFSILGLHKLYVHSRDINVRNMNLNSSFGFELEGVFLEEIPTPDGRRADVVRMALLKPIWVAMFGV
jgi:RimJ/RimL family protein N-acetyltransferase